MQAIHNRHSYISDFALKPPEFVLFFYLNQHLHLLQCLFFDVLMGWIALFLIIPIHFLYYYNLLHRNFLLIGDAGKTTI